MANFIGMVFATLKEEGIDTKGMSTDDAVAKFKELQKSSGGKEGETEGTPAEQRKVAEMTKKEDVAELKNKQLDIINKNNPMTDDYHVGIRSVDDIKTFEETLDDDESFVWGDFSKEDAEKAIEKGSIVVYSSKPIGQGTFVSTSKNQALDYAGGGKIYSQEVPLDKVAWINGDEGQFADTSK